MTYEETIEWLKEQRNQYISSDPYAISLDIAIEALEKQATSEETSDKYRWHDLRKNPDDLPTHTKTVEVELWGEVLGTYYDHTWFKDGNWKHYANNSYGKVIGWREIEPMEGAKE